VTESSSSKCIPNLGGGNIHLHRERPIILERAYPTSKVSAVKQKSSKKQNKMMFIRKLWLMPVVVLALLGLVVVSLSV
jgi:hypothetical protein